MPITMYTASVPVFTRMLNNLAAILDKAEQHAAAHKIDPAVLPASRLFPDMFPLSKQVQIAADAAKRCGALLAQVEVPAYEDTETTLTQLAERCRKTVAFLETLEPAQIDGSEERTVTWKARKVDKSMQGMAYLLTHAMPNFYFHVTTAYDLLRHNGVEVGKQDFLGRS